jgi:hypothetical protein
MKKELFALATALSVLLSTPAIFADAITVSATVSSYISATFNYDTVAFGTLTQGSNNNPAPYNADGRYNVTVSSNLEWKVSAYGTDFSNSGHSFSISNLKMDTDSTKEGLSLSNAKALSTSSQDIDTGYGAGENIVNYNGFWLSIPANQYATSYTSTVTITYSN